MTTAVEIAPGATATKPETKPEIKWVTPEFHKKCQGMIGKQYVRLDPTYKKPAATSKDFFYRITGMHNSVPAYRGPEEPMAPSDDYLLVFHVQKYYRNKMRNVRVNTQNDMGLDPSSADIVQQNEPVKAMEVDLESGNVHQLDSDASIHIEANNFLKEFTADNID